VVAQAFSIEIDASAFDQAASTYASPKPKASFAMGKKLE
jgi:hypothetical protein